MSTSSPPCSDAQLCVALVAKDPDDRQTPNQRGRWQKWSDNIFPRLFLSLRAFLGVSVKSSHVHASSNVVHERTITVEDNDGLKEIKFDPRN